MSNQQTNPLQGTILIVDDNPANLHLLSQILTKQGYKVRVANNGAQAIKSVQSNPPDLILLDVIMPKMDGYEVCKYLNTREQLHNIPVIFLSALDAPEDKIKAFAVGGVDYVTKPLHTEEVLARVKTHLALQGMRRQLEGKNHELQQEIIAHKQTGEALQKSKERFRSLVETTSDWIWEIDQNSIYTYVSPKIENLLGYKPDDVIGKTPLDMMPLDEVERVAARLEEIISSQKPFKTLENVNLHLDGRRVILDTSGVPIFDEKGRFSGYRGIDRDITERVQAIEALRESERKYRNIYTRISDVVYETDYRGNLTGISPSIEKHSGYRPEDLIGQKVTDFFPYPDEYTAINSAMEATGEVNDFEITLMKKSGDLIVVSVTAHIVFDADNQPMKTEGILRDISERKRLEQELQIAATHDALTDLPNRALFIDRLEHGLKKAKRNKEQMAVLFIDLDEFKAINDTHGHYLGDLLLIEFANRVRHSFRESDTVARLSGDEFAMMLESLSEPRLASEIADKLISLCSKPYNLEDNNVSITLSVGISIFPEDATDADALLQRADTAMYQAKQQGKDTYRFYNKPGNK